MSSLVTALLAVITTAFFSWSLLVSSTAEATALTYNVGAHERACFYAWADVPKKKLAFYFAVGFFCLFACLSVSWHPGFFFL
jgi:hypothetical protein